MRSSARLAQPALASRQELTARPRPRHLFRPLALLLSTSPLPIRSLSSRSAPDSRAADPPGASPHSSSAAAAAPTPDARAAEPHFSSLESPALLRAHLAPLLRGAPDGSAGTWQADALDIDASGGWQLAEDGHAIERSWKFRRFRDAWTFLSGVAALATSRKHHPTLHNTHTAVLVRWTTHRDRATHRRGLSRLDLECAAETARLAAAAGPVGVGEENSLAWVHGGGREEFRREFETLLRVAEREGDDAAEGGTSGLDGRNWVGEAEHVQRVWQRGRRERHVGRIERARAAETERVAEIRREQSEGGKTEGVADRGRKNGTQ